MTCLNRSAFTVIGRLFMAGSPFVALPVSPMLAQCGVWSAMGSGMSEGVNTAVAFSNGDVAVGCTNYFGGSAPHIAYWNGSGWSTLGSGVDSTVSALAVWNGNLVAGGRFSTAGGVAAPNIARWNGVLWHPMGPPLNGEVLSLASTANGGLFAAGTFDIPDIQVGGFDVGSWNGNAWSSLGRGVAGNAGYIYALAVLPNGNVIAAGEFTSAGGLPASHIARWNGSNWLPLGSGLNNTVRTLAVLPNGDLIAGGIFTVAGGIPANYIARWNGASWSPLGSGVMGVSIYSSFVSSLAVLSNGDLIAGGLFVTAGGEPANSIARWDGHTWSPLGTGVTADSTQNQVRTLAVLPDGDLVAGGVFNRAGGVLANNVARFSFGNSLLTLTVQPQHRSSCPGGSATFSAAVSNSGSFNYRWRHNGLPIDAAVHPSAETPVLTLAGVQVDDAGFYDCVITGTNGCGHRTSAAAMLFVDPADMGKAGGIAGRDGSHDNNDFIAFITCFFSGNVEADLGSQGGVVGPDASFDNNDFVVFIDQFFRAC